jgi:hypothetical protein
VIDSVLPKSKTTPWMGDCELIERMMISRDVFPE